MNINEGSYRLEMPEDLPIMGFGRSDKFIPETPVRQVLIFIVFLIGDRA